MKINIDRDGCIECGNCEATCKDVFVLKSGQKASVVEKFQAGDPAKGNVPENLNKCAQNAAKSCPVAVISVE